MRSRLSVFLFLHLCIFGTCSTAQTQLNVNYSTKDGLPSSQVYDIIEDDYGYLWFSTDKGLSRFNGYYFENFDKNDGLADNVVFDFLKRPNGEIWCTTNSANIFSFSGTIPNFKRYKYNHTIRKYSNDLITKGIFISDEDELYLAFHRTRGYLKLSNKGKVLSTAVVSNTVGKSEQRIAYLNVLKNDKSAPFFFDSYSKEENLDVYSYYRMPRGFAHEALYFEEKSLAVYIFERAIELKNDKNESLLIPVDNSVISSGKLNDHEFWVGYRNGGVQIYNLNGKLVNSLLSGKSITQVYLDSQGNMWVSTLENGVFLIKNNSINYYLVTIDHNVRSLSMGSQNSLYASCYDGSIFKIAVKNNASETFYPKSGSPAVAIYHPTRKVHYFCSNHLIKENKKPLIEKNTNYLSFLDENYLLMGGTSAMSVVFDLKREQVSTNIFIDQRINSAIEYNDKIYGANINGLWIIDNWNQSSKSQNVLKNIRIDHLNTIGDYLVLGTNGKGVILWNKHHKQICSIKQRDGLTSDYVSKSFTENVSTLWVCTNQGVNRIRFSKDYTSYDIDQMNSGDGLLSNETWDVLVQGDTVWVGTQNGVNYFTKRNFELLQNTNFDYHLRWTSLWVNNSSMLGSNHFTYDQNKLEFNFLGILLNGQEKLTYRYKLKGIDSNWSYTNSTKLIFNSLEAGDYELILQAKGKNERWEQNEINYAFTISPPFWKTNWFILLCTSLVFGLIYLFFKIRILTYNRDIVREILRYLLRKIRRDEPFILIKQNGKELKLNTAEIEYIKTSNNYLEIHTRQKKYVVRSTIAQLLEDIPDKMEFLQVHRSYLIRIDKIQEKGKKSVIISDREIPIGRMYLKATLDRIQIK